FVDSLDQSLPIATYYNLILGRIPPSFKKPEFLTEGRWKHHLAVLASLDKSSVPSDIFKESLYLLCSTLIRSNNIVGYHCCRILLLKSFNTMGKGNERMTLLGHACLVDSTNFDDIEKLLENEEILDSFQLTEIYEFSQNLILPTLMPFKIAFASMLYRYGIYHKSWKYCEHIGKLLLRHWNSECVFDVSTECINKLIEVSYKLLPFIRNNSHSNTEWISQLTKLYTLCTLYRTDDRVSYYGYDISAKSEVNNINHYLVNENKQVAHSEEDYTINDDEINKQTVNIQNKGHEEPGATSLFDFNRQSRFSDSQHKSIDEHSFPNIYEANAQEIPKHDYSNATNFVKSESIQPFEIPNYFSVNTDISVVSSDTKEQNPTVPEQQEFVEQPYLDNIVNSVSELNIEDTAKHVENLEKENDDVQNLTDTQPQKTTLLNRMFGNIFSKPVNQVHLPDDSTSKMIYDEERKKWIDTSTPEEEVLQCNNLSSRKCVSANYRHRIGTTSCAALANLYLGQY
ncbi:hypothetical protein GJ496_007199, partial [Pomphorhynchus laevis]